MKKTVNEIIEMIEFGKLHYDQSTQRKFIYMTMPKIKTEDGEITRAGNVIRSILQFDIQLPALYFWDLKNGEYNIHDGKQRILSIYYFIKPTSEINVITRINGREKSYNGLDESQKQKLLNYEFDIVVKSGSQEEEEQSFYLINTNSVPLTDYESLRGMFHGRWIYEFEKYLEGKAKVFDYIKKIDRGDQAILFLYNCFSLLGDTLAINKVKTHLRDIRNNSFNEKQYNLDSVISLFTEVKRITGVSDERAIQIASFVVSKGWDKDLIMDYYRKITRKDNDIKRWKIETHKTAISKLIQENIECDGKRLFNDDDKSVVYKKSQKCCYPGCTITNYNDLEKDHITPWSKGGRTIVDNLQLLCKTHNAAKGVDEDCIKG